MEGNAFKRTTPIGVKCKEEKPDIDELIGEVWQLRTDLQQRDTTIADLTKQVAELEERVEVLESQDD